MSSLSTDGLPVRFRWEGRFHVVVRSRGPERIETAWWRGPTVRRDYYIFETDRGGRFWMFRGFGNGHGFFMEPMGDVNELFFCSALVVLRKELLIHG